MNHPHLDQAREWAEDVRRIEAEYGSARPDALAGARIIESLPDEWIDADKVRELLDRWAANPFLTWDEGVVLNDVEALLTPSLPTLADLIEQDSDPKKYQWMQADRRDERCVITRVYVTTVKPTVRLLTSNGITLWVDADEVTPLPDLPPLKWPAQEPQPEHRPFYGPITISPPTREEEAEVRKQFEEPTLAALPRPEDVPEGEVWMIRPHENADPVPAFRVHASKYGPGKRWAHYRVGGSMLGFADDKYVTLVSRLVPEVSS